MSSDMQLSAANRRLSTSKEAAGAHAGQRIEEDISSIEWLQELPSVAILSSAYLHSNKKRCFDIVASILLLLMIVPLLAGLLILIRMGSPGPSLFKQNRYGIFRKPFLIFKFRSMYQDEVPCKEVQQAQRNDSRVTPVGKYLRRSSIDEVPQLINVLRGEMSLVGPRPHALSHDDHFSRYVPNYEHRFLAKPGITGLAQVSGSRGATPDVSHMKRRVDLDVEYVRRASFALDCKILLRTVSEVLASDTAF